MLRFILVAILFILIARMFWRLVDAVMGSLRGMPAGSGRSRSAIKLVRDPVCGTYVPPRPALSVTAGGSTHYFCSEECRAKFTQP